MTYLGWALIVCGGLGLACQLAESVVGLGVALWEGLRR